MELTIDVIWKARWIDRLKRERELEICTEAERERGEREKLLLLLLFPDVAFTRVSASTS